jgi:hypothetical protein
VVYAGLHGKVVRAFLYRWEGDMQGGGWTGLEVGVLVSLFCRETERAREVRSNVYFVGLKKKRKRF